MALPFDTKYPSELSNAAWQKHKSFTDKLFSATKTGIGKELSAIEGIWAKTDFDMLDPDALFHKGKSTTDDLKAAQAEAVKISNGPLKQIAKMLKDLSASASKAATIKTLSKDAKTAVANISVAANKLSNKVASYDPDVFQNVLDRQEKQQKETVDRFAAALPKLDKLFKVLASSPNPKSFAVIVKEVSKTLGEMQPATGSLSRVDGPQKKQWTAASQGIKDIESKIPPVVVAIKAKDVKGIDEAIFSFIKVGTDQQAVFKKALA